MNHKPAPFGLSGFRPTRRVTGYVKTRFAFLTQIAWGAVWILNTQPGLDTHPPDQAPALVLKLAWSPPSGAPRGVFWEIPRE